MKRLVVIPERCSRSEAGSRERRETWRTPMARKKQNSPFTGLWHIVSMEMWDEDWKIVQRSS